MTRPMPTNKSLSVALLTLFQNAKNPSLSLRDNLCATLRQAIVRGTLVAQQRLPSSRTLAADLQVSRITVEAAYSQVEAEGYVERHIGKGTFVCADLPALSPAKKQKIGTPPLPIKLSARGTRIMTTGGCIDPQHPMAFASGSPDLRAFPLPLWKQLTNRQLRTQGTALMGYGDPQGYAPLRQAVADYLQQSRGVDCQAEQIVITTSSQQALQLLATLLLDNGDAVWVEQPGYLGARNAFAAAGAQLHPIPVDQQGINPANQLSIPKLIYLTPSHQYPTGVSLSLTRRLEMLDIARRQHSWIIEDDYDSELHYDGRPLPAIQGLDKHQRTIYLGTFSKVLFPSLRLAYVVLPPGLVAPFVTLRTVYDGHSSLLMQAVTAEFIQAGHFAAHLRYMRQLYHSRRDHLLEQIKAKLSDWITPQSTAGGMQLAVKLPAGEEQWLSQQAQKLGVATPRLSPLYLPDSAYQAPVDGWLLGYAALTPLEITAAVDRLAQIPRR